MEHRAPADARHQACGGGGGDGAGRHGPPGTQDTSWLVSVFAILTVSRQELRELA